MKIQTFSVIAVLLTLIGCGNPTNYQISGTIANAQDGDSVFIQKKQDRQFITTDTAIIKDHHFVFNGKQDSVENRYIYYSKNNLKYRTDFFLENGKINILLAHTSRVDGTVSNKTYQAFKDKLAKLEEERQAIYQQIQNPSLTAEQLNFEKGQLKQKTVEIDGFLVQTIKDNITNPVGFHLFISLNYLLNFEEITNLLESLPFAYHNNPRIIKLGEQIAMEKHTAIGQKFIEIEMQNPENQPVRLSDYIYENQYTLIDFWASWCGPCRKEMPRLVALYERYKDKGFEIVGVSLDENLSAWKKSIQDLHISWPQMSDLKLWSSEGARLYAVRSIPFTVLVDKDGIIIDKDLHGEKLSERITLLFEEK